MYEKCQQERGIQLNDNFDIDEETRFSSVNRGKGVDDSGYDEDEDMLSDSHNTETFSGVFGSVIKRSSESIGGKCSDEAQTSSHASSVVSPQSVFDCLTNLDCLSLCKTLACSYM